MAIVLPRQDPYRLPLQASAAERIARLLRRVFRSVAGGPRPIDLAQLSPHWLRDLGLPEDYGRPSRHEGLANRARLERYR